MNIQSKPSQPPSGMSIDAFFHWSETQEHKYELVDGVPRLQPWVKRNHNRITVNIVVALGRDIDSGAFEIATGDFAVPTGPRSVRYADVLVERAGGPGGERTADHALVLIEVLSDSTMHVDFGDKLREYQALSELLTYLIVAQDARAVWQWTRDSGGEWPEHPRIFEADDSLVAIPSIGMNLSFADIYRNVS